MDTEKRDSPDIERWLKRYTARTYPTGALRNDPYIAAILAGQHIERSAELRSLAERALQAVESRKNENIDEWAARLAADVADADD